MIPCPHCGEPVDEKAAACRHCGSDAETGWGSDLDYYEVELPDADDEERHPGLRPESLRAIAILVLVGILVSGFAFGGAVRSLFATTGGKISAIAVAFVVTVVVLRLVRDQR